jgi:putative endonuclease
MAFYVYIIKSSIDGTFYKGASTQPVVRIKQHNEGLCTSTKSKRPWNLIYIEELPSKKEMLIREKKLKRGNKEYFQKKLKMPFKMLNQFR